MKLEAWLALLEQRHPKSIDLGLERCGKVYRRLGSPRPAKKVVTVAGTNGKGSTVAYLAAMTGALGQRYGTYTSPHIFCFNERISIMGTAVSDDVLERAFEQVESARGDTSLTYFEFTTLAGLLILHEANLDCAVLEVGLGGRLDTVNLVDADCVIITPIGLDHQDFLGPDIESIATEKAGVIRAGKPVICSEANPPLPILQTAERLRSPLFLRGDGFDLQSQTSSVSGMLEFTSGEHTLSVPRPSMAGQHQLDNLASALAALLVLNPGCPDRSEGISSAILACRVPGRLQQFGSRPEILLDVGHNELAATAIAAYLKDNQRKDIVCVLAMLADKSAEAVAHELGGSCHRWLCTDSPGPRGQTGQVLAARIRTAIGQAEVLSFETMDETMQQAVALAGPGGSVLVFGSFTTVSAAADWLGNRLRQGGHDAAKLC